MLLTSILVSVFLFMIARDCCLHSVTECVVPGSITDKSDACWCCKVTVLKYVWIRRLNTCSGKSTYCVGYRCSSTVNVSRQFTCWKLFDWFHSVLLLAPVTSLVEVHRKWHPAILYFCTTAVYGNGYLFCVGHAIPKGRTKNTYPWWKPKVYKNDSALNPASWRKLVSPLRCSYRIWIGI
jgi:hypothetical protein